MAEKYFQSVGRRKTAIAQVRLVPGGNGEITVNGKKAEDYFGTPSLMARIHAPLEQVGKKDILNITVRALGGGLAGQADAIVLGIARSLVKYDESLKTVLKTHGFLTRDPRKKERKKFGLRGARRARQWRKR